MVEREREILTKILHYLKEIENRRLYLARGYSSLFAFLTEELGYSESAAQRRIQAMRLIKEIPEVEEKIETGRLSLTVASQVQSFFRQENKKRKKENAPRLNPKEKLDLVKKLEGTSSRTCEKKLAAIAPEINLPKEKTRFINQEKILIQFVANPDLMKKITKLKELLSHKIPEGGYEEIFTELVEIALEKLDPERREARRQRRRERSNTQEKKQSKCTPLLPAPAVELAKPKIKSRYIPQQIRDQIWSRDQGKCQYKDRNTGKICASGYNIQVDHIHPYSLNGENTPNNLRLLCGQHNRYRFFSLKYLPLTPHQNYNLPSQ